MRKHLESLKSLALATPISDRIFVNTQNTTNENSTVLKNSAPSETPLNSSVQV